MIYTVKLGEEVIRVEATDVGLSINEQTGDGIDYNFTNKDDESVARIPFDRVDYIAKL